MKEIGSSAGPRVREAHCLNGVCVLEIRVDEKMAAEQQAAPVCKTLLSTTDTVHARQPPGPHRACGATAVRIRRSTWVANETAVLFCMPTDCRAPGGRNQRMEQNSKAGRPPRGAPDRPADRPHITGRQ